MVFFILFRTIRFDLGPEPEEVFFFEAVLFLVAIVLDSPFKQTTLLCPLCTKEMPVVNRGVSGAAFKCNLFANHFAGAAQVKLAASLLSPPPV